MFSRMEVHCPICRCEMDGMKGYGRKANCCGRECYQEWEWRRTLAIMGQPYETDPRRLSTAKGAECDDDAHHDCSIADLQEHRLR